MKQRENGRQDGTKVLEAYHNRMLATEYGARRGCMETARKIDGRGARGTTQKGTGGKRYEEFTQTVRTGLELMAASRAYARLLEMREEGSFLADAGCS